MILTKGDRFPASDDIVWMCAVASAKQQRCHRIQRREQRYLKVVCKHDSSSEFRVSASIAAPAESLGGSAVGSSLCLDRLDCRLEVESS